MSTDYHNIMIADYVNIMIADYVNGIYRFCVLYDHICIRPLHCADNNYDLTEVYLKHIGAHVLGTVFPHIKASLK